MKPHHIDSTFINKIGSGLIATCFSLTPQRLHMWRKRGIPSDFRLAVARLATQQGVAIPDGFLEPGARANTARIKVPADQVGATA